MLEQLKENEGVYGIPVRDFDIENMTDDQHDQMLGDVYGGYKTRDVARYEKSGAGKDARNATRKVGYDQVTDFDYYKDNKAWKQVADKVGITGAIDNEQELGKMAHYIAMYGRDKEMPMPEAPASNDDVKALPVELSNIAKKADAFVNAYDDKLLPKQGDLTVKGDDIGQQFKDAYQKNLTDDLKTNDPTTLASKQAEIEMKDKYNLDLGGKGLFA